jgi:hypothetical protein
MNTVYNPPAMGKSVRHCHFDVRRYVIKKILDSIFSIVPYTYFCGKFEHSWAKKLSAHMMMMMMMMMMLMMMMTTTTTTIMTMKL